LLSDFKSFLGRIVWSLIERQMRRELDGITLAIEAARRPPIDFADPLAENADALQRMYSALRESANAVGERCRVGNCTILGGRSAKVAGLRLGDDVRIYDGCRLVIDHLVAESGISIEAGSALNFNCYIDGSGGVSIGKSTILGPNVVIVSSNHGLDAERRSEKRLAPVSIAGRVWIGANCVILAGSRIGEGAVIGAGSVVSGEIPPRTIATGSPARAVRDISPSA
jgi:acetyltransferase-like isoleucine patch superfamily enzyme